MVLLRAALVLGLPALLFAAGRHQLVSVKLNQGKTIRLNLSVPPQVISQSALSVANLSLSPWTYRRSHVESRWPRTLSSAQCLTSGCLSLQVQGAGEDAALESRPIRYQVLVLHRAPKRRRSKGEKKRRTYSFSLATEVITVGCTCVRPGVVPQH